MSIEKYQPRRMVVRFGGQDVAQMVRSPAGGVLLRELPALAASGVAVTSDAAFSVVPSLPESMMERGRLWRSLNGVPGWLADSLPDSWGTRALQRYLSEAMARADSTLGMDYADVLARELSGDLLTMLAFVGADSPVGVSFVPDLAQGESKPVALDLVEAVREARAIEAVSHVGGSDFSQLRCGWSAGGARPKTHIGLASDGRFVAGCGVGDLCSRGLEPWLLKLGYDSVTNKTGNQAGRMEYAYYLMAKACGIQMSESRLLEDSGGVGHFITRRFDRDPGAIRPCRSLAGVLNMDKSEPVSYERQWRVQREITASESGAEELFRRVVFNVTACVRDDHARNFAYLLEDGVWKQSPAFDLAFCDAKEHAATISGKGASVSRAALRLYASKLGLARRRADALCDEICSVCTEWPVYAGRAKVSDEMTAYIGKFVTVAVTKATVGV